MLENVPVWQKSRDSEIRLKTPTGVRSQITLDQLIGDTHT